MFRFAGCSSIVLLIDAQLGSPLSSWKRLRFLGLRPLGLNRQEINNPRHTLVDRRAQGTAMQPPRRLNVFQGYDFACVFLADGPAEKFITVKDPDFGEIARIITDRHGVPDITRHGWMLVTQPLKMNAIASHGSWLRVHHEQKIKFFEAFWQSRQEALTAPSIERRLVRFTMGAGMIRVGDIGCDCLI
jgi:hypothetical protein